PTRRTHLRGPIGIKQHPGQHTRHHHRVSAIHNVAGWLRGKRIGVRIARKGIESRERLGRRRWVIERTMS
ncbi:hypothetical protein ABZ776_20070, partial [Streptomyces sp. NPDC007076]